MTKGHHISLFAGIGGVDIAAERLGCRTVLTAELDDFCKSVLTKRFPSAQHFSDVSLTHKDVLDPTPRPLLVSGGFPCQDISNPGVRAGMQGKRSGPLWQEMVRVINEFQPEHVLVENVSVMRNRGLDQVLWDLYASGYDARWDCIPAASFGAPHIRDRIYVQAWRKDQQRVGGDTSAAVPITMADGWQRSGHMTEGMVSQEPPRFSVSQARSYALRNTDGWFNPRARARSAKRRLWPTPTYSDGTGGPGTSPKRTGGMNLRTAVVAAGNAGSLNPAWVEWLMGFPLGWTDPEISRAGVPARPHPWTSEPSSVFVPRTLKDVPNRRARLCALGNAVVPGVAEFVLKELLAR